MDVDIFEATIMTIIPDDSFIFPESTQFLIGQFYKLKPNDIDKLPVGKFQWTHMNTSIFASRKADHLVPTEWDSQLP